MLVITLQTVIILVVTLLNVIKLSVVAPNKRSSLVSRKMTKRKIYNIDRSKDDFLTARHLLSGASHVFQEWSRKSDSVPEMNEELREKVNKIMWGWFSIINNIIYINLTN